MSEIPPSPPPYRKETSVSAIATQPKPATFLDGLQSPAIRDAKAGRPIAVAELPSTPDMPPLPPQKPVAVPKGPAPGSIGFDKMIAAARAGLPVSIRSTPVPPQATTSQTTLQPKIVSAGSSTTGVEGRGEALALMEKALIEQVQLAENSRMRFTRLGDVGKIHSRSQLLEE
ncbi:unnamed protein product [Strongylus vulgaris]|uniref:Uncharacterized protein n=1 Tax=Strongylus vulgaris TaxID=40348 RepID=A0A3P7JGK7_STRVU|nr:unnamed protein product [Strongylus vulgaris]